jgi:isoleucyl-tRNA synthetase
MYDFKKTEDEVLKFWRTKKIYSKVNRKNSKGKKFYFMDGPPYATGSIHMGTALNKILKDIAMRSQRMQGKDVFDRPGYDTHGVPIEFQIEKEIGSKSKQDIEKYGVKKFVKKCKEYATKHLEIMNSQFANLGVWMDWENPYLTLDDDYMSAIWHTFKEADRKKLLYLGKYPVHLCPRCATSVAYNEIEYTKQKDTAIYVKFPLVKPKSGKKTYLVIWTTTPWTLPGNTGVMVHPNFEYQEIGLSNGEHLIIAKEKVKELFSIMNYSKSFKHIKTWKGKELRGIGYENPLGKDMNLNKKDLKGAYKVVLSSRFVNLDEGSGLVHVAPGHGKEDYEVGKKNGLPGISLVDLNGNLTSETGKYSGGKAREIDREIISDLENGGFLLHKHTYKHDYPVCWRCKSSLLMVSLPQWFFKIDEIQKRLLSENDKVNWLPKYMKSRMKYWLEGISDWPISRMRYWGTPLPIWICDSCNDKKVVGSKEELEKLAKKKVKEMHKPEIDDVKIPCRKSRCKGKLSRVPEVLDVWFDSGVSSWAALDYPKSSKKIKKYWPADLNIEGKDQIRGWWNSQAILSMIAFGKRPYDAISVHGMVLDLGKRKMSKSKGNIVSPEEVIEKYGRDAIRYYFAKNSKGEDFAFNENEFRDINNFLRVLLNVNNFVNQIGNGKTPGKPKNLKVEDKWALSRLNNVSSEIISLYNEYNYPKAVEVLESFLMNDISKTYIQIIRDRSDDASVKYVLNEVRRNVLLFLSPVMPFLSEEIYRNSKLGRKESIFLDSFEKVDKKKINKKLEEEFDVVLKVIEVGLSERDKEKIGLKWPLAGIEISCGVKLNKDLEKIIARQLNVKNVVLKKNKGNISVTLDTKMTPELEAEGYAREISRAVQASRKKAGLVKSDKINLVIVVDENLLTIIQNQKNLIKDRTNSSKLEFSTHYKGTSGEKFLKRCGFVVKDKRGEIVIKKA